jgi:hypothetical protein
VWHRNPVTYRELQSGRYRISRNSGPWRGRIEFQFRERLSAGLLAGLLAGQVAQAGLLVGQVAQAGLLVATVCLLFAC